MYTSSMLNTRIYRLVTEPDHSDILNIIAQGGLRHHVLRRKNLENFTTLDLAATCGSDLRRGRRQEKYRNSLDCAAKSHRMNCIEVIVDSLFLTGFTE